MMFKLGVGEVILGFFYSQCHTTGLHNELVHVILLWGEETHCWVIQKGLMVSLCSQTTAILGQIMVCVP